MSALRKSNGKWVYRVTFRHPDGRSERISGTPAINTRKEAEDAELAHLTRLLHPTKVVVKSTAPLFNAFVTEWIKTYPASVGSKPSTVKNYEFHLRMHLLPLLGERHLDEIDARTVSNVFAELRTAEKDLADGTIHQIGMTFHRILASAREWGVIASIPAFPKRKVATPDFDYYSKEEAAKIVASAPIKDRALLLFALRTGARQGEQIALRWEDVDIERGTIRIRRSYKDGVTSTPKNGKERTVPMSAELKNAMEDLRQEARGGELVFTRDTGGTLRFEPWHMVTVLERACRAANVRVLRWHDLRHTFASHAMQSGVPIRQLQAWMGHATITQTMRYAHMAKNLDEVTLVSALDSNV